MRRLSLSLITFLFAGPAAVAAGPPVVTKGSDSSPMVITKTEPTFFDLLATGGDGQLRPLHEFRGQVVMAVNTASRCGYTPQYEGLQKVHSRFKGKGFTVLGFPSNDFGGQEPGSDKEIKEFCKVNFNIDFPLFQKNAVKGDGKQPVFKFLTEHAPKEQQGEVKWNFEKFLVNRKGEVAARYPSSVKPDDAALVAKLEELLQEPAPAAQPKSKAK